MRAKGAGTLRDDGRWMTTVTVTSPTGAKRKVPVYGATQAEMRDNAQKIREGRNARPKVRFAALVDEVRKVDWEGRLLPATIKGYDTHVRKLLAAFGKMWVHEVTSPRISALMREIVAGGLSGRSAQKTRDVLSGIMDYARERGIVETNPAKGLRLPKSAKPKARVRISWPILARLMEHEENPVMRRYFLFLAETGLRPNREALGLTRADLVRRMDLWWVRVAASKTDAGIREVPVPDYLANLLVDLPEEETPGGLLFPGRLGGRMEYRNVIRHWAWVYEKSGLEYTNIYQLRKLASREFRQNLSDEALIALIGHTRIETTREHYIGRDMDAIAMQAGKKAVGKAVNPVPLGLDRHGDG